MRTLVVRFAAMGDCVMAAWAATAVRNAHPDGELDWAVESRCAEVIDTDRLATRRHEFPRDRWKQGRWSVRTWRDQVSHYSRLRQRDYDLGFDLQGHSKTALCLYLAKPRRKIAAFATDALARRLNPLAGDPKDGQHMVEWFGEVIGRLGSFTLPERPLMPVPEPPRTPGAATIAVGAGQPGKTLSHDAWARVGRLLLEEGWKVAYVGGPNEAFEAPERAVNLVGKTTLRQLIGQIAGSGMVLAGDTGAGHIAAAYGIPILSVFGANDPRFFRPYTSRGRVLKRGDRCDFAPEEIVRESKLLMEGRWPSGS
ncbi:MAG TPA: glycosyltransferase family 9 protein [Fimbriimonas sp.]